MWSQQSPPGAGAPPEQRQRTAFFVTVAGAVLCLVGVMLGFIKGTNAETGLSETDKGLDKPFGVGWWPVLYAVLAVVALYLVQRRPDLSKTAFGAVASGLGLLDLVYVFLRQSDAADQIKKMTYGYVTGEAAMGYYVLLLGAGLTLAGAVWFTVLARGGVRRVPVGGVGQHYPTGYYQAQAQPPQGYTPQPPPQPMPPQAVPAPPTAAAPPQQPNPVYPGQAPPPPQ